MIARRDLDNDGGSDGATVGAADATANATGATVALVVAATAGMPGLSAPPREHASAAVATQAIVESVPSLTAMCPSVPQEGKAYREDCMRAKLRRNIPVVGGF